MQTTKQVMWLYAFHARAQLVQPIWFQRVTDSLNRETKRPENLE